MNPLLAGENPPVWLIDADMGGRYSAGPEFEFHRAAAKLRRDAF